MLSKSKVIIMSISLAATVGLISGCKQSKQESSPTKQPQSASISPSPTPPDNVPPFNGSITFRNVGWGMSQAQVKKAETAQLDVDADEVIIYHETIADIPVQLNYNFTNKQLTGADYQVKDTSDYDKCLKQYEVLRKAYTGKYGKKSSDVISGDEKDQWSTSRWPELLAQSKISFATTWDTHDKQISIILHRLGSDLAFYVEYKPKDMDKLDNGNFKL